MLIPFGILYVLSTTIFREAYLFKWTADDTYYYVWLLVVLFVFLDKKIYACILSVANFIGIFVGEYLGSWIKQENMKLITEKTSAEQVWRLHLHYGALIWLCFILVSLFIIAIIHIYKKYYKGKC